MIFLAHVFLCFQSVSSNCALAKPQVFTYSSSNFSYSSQSLAQINITKLQFTAVSLIIGCVDKLACKVRVTRYFLTAKTMLLFHWDDNIMTNQNREVKDRLAILISGYPHFKEGKLVTVADISDEKGRAMADKILQEPKKEDLSTPYSWCNKSAF